MTDKRTVILRGPSQRDFAKGLIDRAPVDYVVEIHAAKRSDRQNARLWAMLEDVATQLLWHGQRLTKEEWKDLFTAGLKRSKVVPGIDGGFVVLGGHTSKMTVREMNELLALLDAFGTQGGVVWSEPHPDEVAA